MNIGRPPSMTLARLHARCRLEDSHLRWQGFHNKKGYGRSSLAGTKEVLVHRIAYILGVGPIRPGMTIDHIDTICGVEDCCTLEHLEQVPIEVNVQRAKAHRHVTRTTCKQGHIYFPGQRYCRECVRPKQAAYAREKYQAQKAGSHGD